MYEQVEKPKENKSTAIANATVQLKTNGTSIFQIADNRPDATAQRKLQQMIDNSSGTAQLKAMVDNQFSQQQQPIQSYSNTTKPQGGKLGKEKDMIVFKKKLYAPTKKVDQANSLLAKAGPFGALIRLRCIGDEFNTEDAPDVNFQKVDPVVDEESKRRRVEASPMSHHAEMENPESGSLKMWADCGRASEVVTGSSPGTIESDRKVKFGGQFGNKQSGGYRGELDREAKNDSKTGRLSMAVYTESIFSFIDEYGLDGLSETRLKELFPELAELEDMELYEAKYEKLRLARESISTAERLYSALTPDAKDKFHEFTSTNEYANPDVGEAYGTVTEYGMPGFEESGDDWSFHWGGVVMKDSADNVTLENLSVSKPNKRNSNWFFAMYGTQDKDQTFHSEQTNSGHHGSIATTISVTTSKAHPEERQVFLDHCKEILKLKIQGEKIYKANEQIWVVGQLYSYFDDIMAGYRKEFHDTGESRMWYLNSAKRILIDMATGIKEYHQEL